MPHRKTNMKKTPIPEDFELSDEDPTMIKLDGEQKLKSKFITFDCPLCHGKLQIQNTIEINPKGIKCSCNPCSFKISKSEKTMNVSRDDNGDISWNRQITPEDKDKESTNRMITDVMNPTPRSKKKQSSIQEMDLK